MIFMCQFGVGRIEASSRSINDEPRCRTSNICWLVFFFSLSLYFYAYCILLSIFGVTHTNYDDVWCLHMRYNSRLIPCSMMMTRFYMPRYCLKHYTNCMFINIFIINLPTIWQTLHGTHTHTQPWGVYIELWQSKRINTAILITTKKSNCNWHNSSWIMIGTVLLPTVAALYIKQWIWNNTIYSRREHHWRSDETNKKKKKKSKWGK